MSFNQTITPKAYTVEVTGSSIFGVDPIEFPGTAISLIIDNSINANDLTVRLNGDEDCTFKVRGETFFTLNKGEAHITSIDFQYVTSGSNVGTVQVIAGIVA